MSFNFKDECKKRYNERVDEYLSKYPKEMDNYEGCVYFIGELSPIRVSESKASIMLDFIDRLEDKRNYKHLDLFLEQYRHDKKYEDNYEAFRYIKIGHSIEPKIRLKTLQTSSPRELILLGTIDNVDVSFEKNIHKYLENLIYGCRVRGEWFDFSLIKSHIRTWLYPLTKNYYFSNGFYDEEQDLLKVIYRDTYYYQEFLNSPTKPKDLPEKELAWMDKNSYQFTKGHTIARKTHLDMFGDIIRKDDTYYKMGSASESNSEDKLSCVSLIKLIEVLETSGIKTNMSNLKYHLKEAYNNYKPEDLASRLGFQYDFLTYEKGE